MIKENENEKDDEQDKRIISTEKNVNICNNRINQSEEEDKNEEIDGFLMSTALGKLEWSKEEGEKAKKTIKQLELRKKHEFVKNIQQKLEKEKKEIEKQQKQLISK